MSEYVIRNGVLYKYDSELCHYGVKGMKWGVIRYHNPDGTLTAAGKKRDDRLRRKVGEYSNEAERNAYYATNYAKQRMNGSQYLSKSDKYIKKAEKAASKMSDKGDSLQDNRSYRNATYANKVAGENYVKRSAGAKAATLAGSVALSTGAVFASRMMGLPYTMIYITDGGDYKLRDTNG